MDDADKKDLAAGPLSFLLAWGLPLLAFITANLAEDAISTEATVLILAGSFAWMGIACVLNARRCRRRHCYYSGPVFLLGAAAIVLVGFEIVPPGRERLGAVIGATLALVALTFVSELFWGSTSRRGRASGAAKCRKRPTA